MQGVYKLFILLFENNSRRTACTGYFLSKVEIKDFNMIDGEHIFHQPIKNILNTYDITQKITIHSI